MTPRPDRWLLPLLRCPVCRGSLDEAYCTACDELYPSNDGQLDLRLRREVGVHLPIVLTPELPSAAPAGRLRCGESVPTSELPHHLPPDLASWIIQRDGDSLVLDLGCGNAQNRPYLEAAGYRYVGVDYSSANADLLGDAHRLPFEDGTFSLVVAMAVLEHLHHPYLAVAEIHRVLSPGGRFVGSVAFQEPYHSRSYFHHSHLATRAVLESVFDHVEVGVSDDWDVLRAHAKSSLFPGLPRTVRTRLLWPASLLSRFLWWLRRRVRRTSPSPTARASTVAGAFRFVADRA